MAGSIAVLDGTSTTTLVLDGVQADIESTMRKAAKKFNYTGGDADTDPLATVYEFVVSAIWGEVDVKYSGQVKVENLTTAAAAVTPISLPGAIATTP